MSDFHEELRRRNLPLLIWTAVIFNPVYLAWSGFDRLLVPEQWIHFFWLRLAVFVINFCLVLAVLHLGLRRYTWEAFWILVFVYCAFVSPMLPLVGPDNLQAYVIGYVMVLFGMGLIPVWSPRWAATVAAASVGLTCAVVLSSEAIDSIPAGALWSNGFVVVTAAGFSIVATVFRYDLSRRDYRSRAEISAVAQREFEARASLAEASRNLQEALEKLKEVDRLKSQFFANISHELRTPLTLIIAPVDELAQVIDDRHQKQQLRVIRNNAERLLGLINDLLDLSRLDAGGLRLNLTEMDVRSVAATVHENSLPAAVAKNIHFSLIADASDNRVLGDFHRLEMVLTNLVANAIKFTPHGGRIELRIRDLEEGVLLEVEDSGAGIPRELQSRVFERFFQVSPSDRRREGGVGIGLALAKELVELHGGRIGVESEPDTFTRFAVFLPFGRDHINPEVIERRQHFRQEAALGRRAEDGAGIPVAYDEPTEGAIQGRISEEEPLFGEGERRPRIVLAEDHEEVREFIRTLLEPHAEVSLASNGEEAWSIVREDPPDLVVSDVMMPGMSGTSLCRAIKADPTLRSTPVILLTARVGSEATLEAYAHGADDFVAKPFHPRVLIARIRAQLKLRVLGLQLAQHEKLAAVGTLAAGILHELRNPVNAVVNAARLLGDGVASSEIRSQLIGVIAEGARRIEDITSALDTHARPAEGGATVACDLREGIDATVRLLGHRLHGVVVHRNYTTERPARVPAGPINQVFLNLLDNAVRAGADTIWVSLEEREGVLCVRVTDNGPGIDPGDADRIFRPFYTKRTDGTGIGLGLYLSRRIVEEFGGSLRLAADRGRRADFVVEVPAV